jgi:hypothetical protein
MERFCQYPDCKDFTLSKAEEIQLVIRRHWIKDLLIFSKWLFWGPIFFFGGIAVFFYSGGTLGSGGFYITGAIALIYLLVVTFYFFIEWLNHVFDIIFLTNDRVIDVTQKDFWHRNIIETRLDHVQDATGDVKGVLHTLFDWGTIKIRTANDIADFSIDTVQGAHNKAREIFALANKARQKEINHGKEKGEKPHGHKHGKGHDHTHESEKKEESKTCKTPTPAHPPQDNQQNQRAHQSKQKDPPQISYSVIKTDLRKEINSLLSRKK